MVIGKIILIRYFFYRSVSYSLNFFMIIFNAAHFLQILLVSVKKVRLSLSFLCRIQVVQAWNRLTASIFQSPTCNSNRFDRINNCAHCAVIYIYISICVAGNMHRGLQLLVVRLSLISRMHAGHIVCRFIVNVAFL